jgi:hypothetical protein
MDQSAKRLQDINKLESRIPGWGSDLDPKNRPAVPKEKTPPHGTGAHWTQPEKQIQRVKIHRSVERRELTPVFGTSCPPKGLSGFIRDQAYKLSEGRNAHWMMLLLADRIDVLEGKLTDLLQGRLSNPIAESGLMAEWRRHGFRSRANQNRADLRRYQNQALLGVVAAAATWLAFRSIKIRRNS